jgi:hypothetical protein
MGSNDRELSFVAYPETPVGVGAASPCPFCRGTGQQVAIPSVLTVEQFSKKHSAFTQGALRKLIFHAKARKSSKGKIPSNGLEYALDRRGRRVYITERKFFEWHQVQDDPRLLNEWIALQKEAREQLVA